TTLAAGVSSMRSLAQQEYQTSGHVRKFALGPQFVCRSPPNWLRLSPRPKEIKRGANSTLPFAWCRFYRLSCLCEFYDLIFNRCQEGLSAARAGPAGMPVSSPPEAWIDRLAKYEYLGWNL